MSLPTKPLTIIIPLQFQVTVRVYLITSDNIVYEVFFQFLLPILMRIQNLVQLQMRIHNRWTAGRS